eukprot:UN07971
MTYDTFQRLGDLFEEIKVAEMSPTVGITQSIYDISHHKHKELPPMHCEVANSCGLGSFSLTAHCHLFNATAYVIAGSKVDRCREHLEKSLPPSVQNPGHELSIITTRFDDVLSHKCIRYGANSCSTLNDFTLDAKYYWKCRVYGTSEYSREACNVQYCPWPLCQMSEIFKLDVDSNNNNQTK